MVREQRAVITYKQLLNLAHQAGLMTITTDMIQLPTEENGRTAFFKAVVTLEKDGQTKLFTGWADATPGNVAPAMQGCLPRMAETRAKARALRDAVNIGEVAVEELAEYSEGRTGRPSATAATGKPMPPINNSGAQCPYCKVANGFRHRTDCPTLQEQAA